MIVAESETHKMCAISFPPNSSRKVHLIKLRQIVGSGLPARREVAFRSPFEIAHILNYERVAFHFRDAGRDTSIAQSRSLDGTSVCHQTRMTGASASGAKSALPAAAGDEDGGGQHRNSKHTTRRDARGLVERRAIVKRKTAPEREQQQRKNKRGAQREMRGIYVT